MLEFAISVCARWRSSLIDLVSSGGNAYLENGLATSKAHWIISAPYQLQKAMKKPHHEKKNTLPY
jgi:hypothetical protein